MRDPYLYDDVKDIHRIIFGQIFEWTGKYRTIQMVKYEDVLGGDTVREPLNNSGAQIVQSDFSSEHTN